MLGGDDGARTHDPCRDRAADDAQRVHGCIHFLVEFVLVLKGKVGHGPTGMGEDMETVQILQGREKLAEKPYAEDRNEVRLQDLLPIAMVIVGGCEICAEKRSHDIGELEVDR